MAKISVSKTIVRMSNIWLTIRKTQQKLTKEEDAKGVMALENYAHLIYNIFKSILAYWPTACDIMTQELRSEDNAPAEIEQFIAKMKDNIFATVLMHDMTLIEVSELRKLMDYPEEPFFAVLRERMGENGVVGLKEIEADAKVMLKELVKQQNKPDFTEYEVSNV